MGGEIVTVGWNEVWAARQLPPGGLPGVTEASWYEFVERVAEALDIGPETTVFEAGCGAGAFLYPLAENGYVVGGVDSAPALVAIAAGAMPDGRFTVGEASDLDPGESWDVVVATTWFATPRDLTSARGLLARMMAKATHAVAVLDVPDLDTSTPTPGERRAGYDRGWMLRALAEIGASAVQVEDQRLEGDQRPGSRFNVFAAV